MEKRTAVLAILFFCLGAFIMMGFNQFLNKEGDDSSSAADLENRDQVMYVTPEQFEAGGLGSKDDS
ncbi:hypothetical protein R0K18_35325, partial [Pantoea sp. SIMBA_133]